MLNLLNEGFVIPNQLILWGYKTWSKEKSTTQPPYFAFKQMKITTPLTNTPGGSVRYLTKIAIPIKN